LELRQLGYFVAVAEELNFTRAARRVHIAQPPLSQQIRRLEQELGVDLFRRSKRQVALTEAGKEFLDQARRVLRCAAEAREAVGAVGKGERGRLAIAAIYSAAYVIVPRILRAFHARYPRVEVTLAEMSIAAQHRALHEGAIDVGIVRPPTFDTALNYLPIAQDRLIAVLPQRHPLARKQSVSLKEIAAEPFLSLPRALSQSEGARVAELFEGHGLSLDILHEVAEMHSLVCLVAAGLGVSVVPESVSHLRLAGIAYRALATKTPATPIYLVWKKDATSPVLPRLVETARAAMQGTAKSPARRGRASP
jgi:DNA-binding transcriptional LysR family regulator